MTINLDKNQTINLSKAAPGLTKVRAGLGWNPSNRGNYEFDVDVSVFSLSNATGRPQLISDPWFVYYGNKKSPGDAITHGGDNRTGEGAGDDESINVDLTRLDPTIDELSFVVTIHDAVNRDQHFGDVSDAYIKIYNGSDDSGIAQFNLTENFRNEISVQIGSLYKEGADWSFQTIGAGSNNDLGAYIKIYK